MYSPLVVQLLIVMLLGDLHEYWYHRLTHTVAWLWPLHAVHHTPIRLHALKGPRHHVIYFLGRGLVVWAPLMLIGAPPRLVVWQFDAESLTIDCTRRRTAAPVVGSFGAVEPGCYAATQERNPLWNGCARDLE